MVSAPEPRTEQGHMLAPACTLIGSEPAVVCETLLQYAEHHEGVLLWNGSASRVCQGRWYARLEMDSMTVVYSLSDGPIPHVTLRFTTEPTGDGCTNLTVVTEYALAGARMAGVWEWWKARRTAVGLRDGLLVGLKQVLPTVAQHGPDRRGAARVPMHLPAHLRVANQLWRGEAVNLSATGLGMVVAVPLEEAEDVAMVLCAHGAGEVELILPGVRVRARVLVTRAVPHRQGVEVGLWMVDGTEAAHLSETMLPPATAS